MSLTVCHISVSVSSSFCRCQCLMLLCHVIVLCVTLSAAGGGIWLCGDWPHPTGGNSHWRHPPAWGERDAGRPPQGWHQGGCCHRWWHIFQVWTLTPVTCVTWHVSQYNCAVLFKCECWQWWSVSRMQVLTLVTCVSGVGVDSCDVFQVWL